MQQALDYVASIDWGVFVQRVLWSIPMVIVVMLACILMFRLIDNVGHKKIDYVYAPEEQRELERERKRVIRKRVLVSVFWLVMIFMYLFQYMLERVVAGGVV